MIPQSCEETWNDSDPADSCFTSFFISDFDVCIFLSDNEKLEIALTPFEHHFWCWTSAKFN